MIIYWHPFTVASWAMFEMFLCFGRSRHEVRLARSKHATRELGS